MKKISEIKQKIEDYKTVKNNIRANGFTNYEDTFLYNLYKEKIDELYSNGRFDIFAGNCLIETIFNNEVEIAILEKKINELFIKNGMKNQEYIPHFAYIYPRYRYSKNELERMVVKDLDFVTGGNWYICKNAIGDKVQLCEKRTGIFVNVRLIRSVKDEFDSDFLLKQEGFRYDDIFFCSEVTFGRSSDNDTVKYMVITGEKLKTNLR